MLFLMLFSSMGVHAEVWGCGEDLARSSSFMNPFCFQRGISDLVWQRLMFTWKQTTQQGFQLAMNDGELTPND